MNRKIRKHKNLQQSHLLSQILLPLALRMRVQVICAKGMMKLAKCHSYLHRRLGDGAKEMANTRNRLAR